MLPRTVLPAVVFAAAAQFYAQVATPAQPDADRPPIAALSFPPAGDAVLKIQLVNGVPITSDITVNGKNIGRFLIDTGSDFSMIDDSAARELKLPPVDPSAMDFPRSFSDCSLSLAGVSLAHLPVHPENLAPLRGKSGLFIHGILGGDVLSRMPYTLDFRRQTLTLHNPRTFKPPTDATHYAIELFLRSGDSFPCPINVAAPRSGQPILAGTLNELPLQCMLDTGSNVILDIPPPFALAHEKLVDAARSNVMGTTRLQGGSITYPLKDPQFKLFDATWDASRGAASLEDADPAVVRNYDAVVGSPVLRTYRLTFNYATKELWSLRQPLPTVVEQLAAGVDPDTADAAGNTLIMTATRERNAAGIEALLKTSTKLDVSDNRGKHLLTMAVEAGNLPLVRRLLAAGVKPDSADATGWTPLMSAVRLNDPAIAKALLEAGADPNAFDKSGVSVLHSAAGGTTAALELLLADPRIIMDRPDKLGFTPLHSTVAGGDPKTFELLVKHGARADFPLPAGATMVLLAASAGNAPMIEYLAATPEGKKKLNTVTKNAGTPLTWAASCGSRAGVAALLRAGAEITADDHTNIPGPVHAAAYMGHPRTLEILLKAHGDPNRLIPQGTPLMLAASANNHLCLQLLLDAGASVATANPDNESFTALHIAAKAGYPVATRILLAAKADPNAPADHGATPLHLAAAAGHTAVVYALLVAGADRMLKNEAGETPLDLARRNNHTYVIDLLESPPATAPATKPSN